MNERIFTIFASLQTLKNALCYSCFSRNLAKIYRTSILTNFSRCNTKQKPVEHLVVFLNLLMLVVIKGHTYLKKLAKFLDGSLLKYDSSLLPDLKGLKCVLETFKEQSPEIRSVSPAVFLEKAALKIFRKSQGSRPWQSTYWKLITMLNLSSIADIFLRMFWEQLF